MSDSPLDLDSSEQHRFDYALSTYGVEIAGGTPDSRQAVVHNRVDEPIATVDCRPVNSTADLIEAALSAVGLSGSDLDYVEDTGHIDLQHALERTEQTLVILEFDALSDTVQTDLARRLKGIAESLSTNDIGLVYTAGEPGTVVQAEPDLRGRVRTYTIH